MKRVTPSSVNGLPCSQGCHTRDLMPVVAKPTMSWNLYLLLLLQNHVLRVPDGRATFVRAMLFANKAMATRDLLEQQVGPLKSCLIPLCCSVSFCRILFCAILCWCASYPTAAASYCSSSTCWVLWTQTLSRNVYSTHGVCAIIHWTLSWLSLSGCGLD